MHDVDADEEEEEQEVQVEREDAAAAPPSVGGEAPGLRLLAADP